MEARSRISQAIVSSHWSGTATNTTSDTSFHYRTGLSLVLTAPISTVVTFDWQRKEGFKLQTPTRTPAGKAHPDLSPEHLPVPASPLPFTQPHRPTFLSYLLPSYTRPSWQQTPTALLHALTAGQAHRTSHIGTSAFSTTDARSTIASFAQSRHFPTRRLWTVP